MRSPRSVRQLTLIVALAVTATPVAAQQLIAGPRASEVWAPSGAPSARLASAAAIPDTIRSRPTHWREGALVGGITGALVGAWFVGSLCANSDVAQDCTGATLGGAVVLGAAAGTLGALIGGLFPKPGESATPPSETAT